MLLKLSGYMPRNMMIHIAEYQQVNYFVGCSIPTFLVSSRKIFRTLKLLGFCCYNFAGCILVVNVGIFICSTLS